MKKNVKTKVKDSTNPKQETKVYPKDDNYHYTDWMDLPRYVRDPSYNPSTSCGSTPI